MKVSINWLRRYVDIEEDPGTLARDLTMFGLNVEGIENDTPEFSGVVFGKVIECGRHPQADRLSVCKVDAGSGKLLNIVCGAPNVRKGLSVAVAVNGAVLPGGFKIKKTKLRGEVSEGMICSETELGTGDDSSGIIELDMELEPGADLSGRLGKGDTILDIEVTPNRPDQLSHLGIAREIAALYKRELRLPETLQLGEVSDYRIEIENREDCPRYSAAFINGVKAGPSPDWMKALLISAGVKPISNIVDITNFVLMEMGQPLHAFDRDKLAGDMIHVRRAGQEEKLVTLDGVERDLCEEILVIADRDKPVGVAGVMGGCDSEVTDGTKRILLESAMFDPRAIRSSSHTLKLDTEASYRFEREGDIGVTVGALERACWLIEETGAGTVERQYADNLADQEKAAARKIDLRVKQANRLMGTRLAADDLVELLERLDLRGEVRDKNVTVSIPSFRRDLKEEVDLIEETARVYGYENIGREEERKGNIFSRVSIEDSRNEDISTFLASRGYAEMINSSFMDPEDTVRFGWKKSDPRRNPVVLENPLSIAQSVLRTSLMPGMLKAVSRNAPVDQEVIKVFEMSKIFLPVGSSESLPDEQLHLTAMFTRHASQKQWTCQQRELDYFDMKGELEALLRRFAAPEELQMERSKEEEPAYIYNWLLKNKIVAQSGLIPSTICSRYDIDTPVFFFTLLMDVFHQVGFGEPRYSGVSPYPLVKRDLCVVAPDRVTFADIKKVVEKKAKYLEFIRLFDYYRGENLGEGKRSYTFRMAFRSQEETLDDKAVDRVINRTLESLQRELQVYLRME